MEDELALHSRRVRERFVRALNLSLAFVVVLGAVYAALPAAMVRALSVQPGELTGLLGVLTAPLLHGSVGHLAANAFALVALGSLAGTVYPRASLRALPLLWLGSGLTAWALGGGGYHLGASGVSHGLGFLLFGLGVLRRDRPAIAAGLIAFFLFGGMVLTVLPQEAGVSWQSHLGGAVAGALAAWRWRWLDPRPPRAPYSWEVEDAHEAREPTELEPPAPVEVPVLWHRPEPPVGGIVLPFRPRSGDDGPSGGAPRP